MAWSIIPSRPDHFLPLWRSSSDSHIDTTLYLFQKHPAYLEAHLLLNLPLTPAGPNQARQGRQVPPTTSRRNFFRHPPLSCVPSKEPMKRLTLAVALVLSITAAEAKDFLGLGIIPTEQHEPVVEAPAPAPIPQPRPVHHRKAVAVQRSPASAPAVAPACEPQAVKTVEVPGPERVVERVVYRDRPATPSRGWWGITEWLLIALALGILTWVGRQIWVGFSAAKAVQQVLTQQTAPASPTATVVSAPVAPTSTTTTSNPAPAAPSAGSTA